MPPRARHGGKAWVELTDDEHRGENPLGVIRDRARDLVTTTASDWLVARGTGV